MVAGDRVLVVGGSSGIGIAAAKLFVQQGAETTVASHDPDKLNEAVRRIGQGARARQLVSECAQRNSEVPAIRSSLLDSSILVICDMRIVRKSNELLRHQTEVMELQKV